MSGSLLWTTGNWTQLRHWDPQGIFLLMDGPASPIPHYGSESIPLLDLGGGDKTTYSIYCIQASSGWTVTVPGKSDFMWPCSPLLRGKLGLVRGDRMWTPGEGYHCRRNHRFLEFLAPSFCGSRSSHHLTLTSHHLCSATVPLRKAFVPDHSSSNVCFCLPEVPAPHSSLH